MDVGVVLVWKGGDGVYVIHTRDKPQYLTHSIHIEIQILYTGTYTTI